MDNNSELKKKVAGNLDQLKSMVNSYGPEARRGLDQTYSQTREVIAGSIGIGTVGEVTQIVQEKYEKVKQMRDEAWEKEMIKNKMR